MALSELGAKACGSGASGRELRPCADAVLTLAIRKEASSRRKIVQLAFRESPSFNILEVTSASWDSFTAPAPRRLTSASLIAILNTVRREARRSPMTEPASQRFEHFGRK